MLASGPLIVAFLLALTFSVAWVASLPVDDPYSTANQQWNGTSELVEVGFQPVASDFTGTLASANSSALLLIDGPSRQFTPADADAVKGFVTEGRVVVIADNFGTGNTLLNLLGLSVRFDGRLLVDPLFYSKEPDFPLLFDLPSSDLSLGVNKTVLNYATVLAVQPGTNVKVLGSSSPFSFLDVNRNGKKESDEPSGAFPVLAEVAMGEGDIILFSSPASFTNNLIHEADNLVLLGNMVKRASQPNQGAVPMLDQTHLEASPFSPAKLIAKELMTEAVNGGMALTTKLGLAAGALMIAAARFTYKRPSRAAPKKAKPPESSPLLEVDSIMRLHPTWDRGKLEYVAREMEASMRWRRLREPT
jgi:hypothetical protein